MYKGNKGFALIELIVVVAIIAILAAIAVPSFIGLISKSKQGVDVANLKTLNKGRIYMRSLRRWAKPMRFLTEAMFR